jgi:hypothetical protein
MAVTVTVGSEQFDVDTSNLTSPNICFGGRERELIDRVTKTGSGQCWAEVGALYRDAVGSGSFPHTEGVEEQAQYIGDFLDEKYRASVVRIEQENPGIFTDEDYDKQGHRWDGEGNPPITGMFKSYSSAKSNVVNAHRNGVDLFNPDGSLRPKSQVDKGIKEAKEGAKTSKEKFDIVFETLKKCYANLDSSEQMNARVELRKWVDMSTP